MTGPRTNALPDVTLEMLYRLLGVEDHESRRELIRRGRQVSPRLPHLLISAAAREGVPLGTGTRDELRRARARADRYADLYDAVRAAVPGVRITKGPSVARWYPPDLLRPVGDLDLGCETEDELWRAARTVAERAPVEDIDLALTRHEDRTDVTLALKWPSEDELLDQPHSVELSTVAFPGDLDGTVPPRFALPADQILADLLSLAEERFQRPFTAKDTVDALMILTYRPPDPTTLAEAAEAHLLAPELLELLTLVQDGAQTPLDGFCTPLRAPAAAERARRDATSRPHGTPHDTTTVDGRLDAGLPVAGLRLNRRRSPVDRAVRHDTDGVSLLRTPLADFLLVCGEVVSRADHDAALAALDRLEAAR
ncbi:hypothetical protein [Streptomyces acidiscabies]|uniref:hypothetical protein n=1 Tax=Streptomyces acidiscabies TaxID=42234 RepID=UPI000B119418|nr:hypothetical protein [Streptomyces acidiscabies]